MKSGPDSARVLLISAHGGKGMVFPKVRRLCKPLCTSFGGYNCCLMLNTRTIARSHWHVHPGRLGDR